MIRARLFFRRLRNHLRRRCKVCAQPKPRDRYALCEQCRTVRLWLAIFGDEEEV